MGKDSKIVSLYFRDIYRQSFCEIWSCFGIWGRIIDGFLLLLSTALAIIFGIKPIPFLGEWYIWASVSLVVLAVIPGAALINSIKVAALRDSEQCERLSLKEYRDINVVPLEYDWTNQQKRMGVFGPNHFKFGLLVTNSGGVRIRDCALRMVSIEYCGVSTDNCWSGLDLIETKLFKWDEGYNPKDGKITITSNGGKGRISFTESNPVAQEFHFMFIDGPSNRQNREGNYRIFVQLEGQVEKNGLVVDLNPPKYHVEFIYRHRFLLDPRVSKTSSRRTPAPPDGLPASHKKAASKKYAHRAKASRKNAHR